LTMRLTRLFYLSIFDFLKRVRHWLEKQDPNGQHSLRTEWLSLALFDSHSHFCLSCGTDLTFDVTLVRDEMTVISYGPVGGADGSRGDYRKIRFHSDAEFEIFLKLELRRLIRNHKRQAAAPGPVPEDAVTV